MRIARYAKPCAMIFAILLHPAATEGAQRLPTLAEAAKAAKPPMRIQATGRREAHETVVAGQTHGRALYYHPNGRLKAAIEWVHGKKQGTYNLYREDGSLEQIVRFKDGEQHGTQRAFFTSGELQKESEMRNGMAEGLEREYDRNGNVTVATEYAGGKKISSEKFGKSHGREPVREAASQAAPKAPVPAPVREPVERRRPEPKFEKIATAPAKADLAAEPAPPAAPAEIAPGAPPAGDLPGPAPATGEGEASSSDTLSCESTYGEVRTIEVVPLEGAGCKAYYTKNGKRQQLYHSRKLVGECSKAAKRLVDKLESANFRCGPAS